MYAVILAGGGGTRLWPLSSPGRPKPFLPLLGDRSLLQLTVDRLTGLMPPEDVFVVTDRRYGEIVRTQLPQVRVLPEPVGRNTAAAIALATVGIERPDDEVMLVLPADHWIGKVDVFQGVLRGAAAVAEGALDIEGPLVTLGIQPTGPSSDYGYLLPNLDHGADLHDLRVYPLDAFEEKPTQARAHDLYGRSGTAWNAGIFVWRREAIRSALERYTSLMTVIGPAYGSELALQMAYDLISPLSIDRAVMEGAAQDHRVVMASMDVGWSDVGNWTALLEVLPGHRAEGAHGRVVPPGEAIELGVDDLLVHSTNGHLMMTAGPQESIRSESPMALLAGARADERALDALLERVIAQESGT
ncbi:MAG: mannose-1-phosphate guanylyltransferase [Chloroflexi bacterium]|nr:MAG: mannose-1-phosphate guanylyltransferase [Chloroflexota bacterium]